MKHKTNVQLPSRVSPVISFSCPTFSSTSMIKPPKRKLKPFGELGTKASHISENVNGDSYFNFIFAHIEKSTNFS